MALETDVVICGSGSAGICASVWLAQAGIPFRMLERRSGPLELGQADGVQCRTVEIFQSFGIAEELLREACHIVELTFWSIDKTSGKLVRTSRAPDTPQGLSHLPHVILNQARINRMLLDKMRSFAPTQTVDYDHTVTAVYADPADRNSEYPIRVHATHAGQEKEFRAKYVLACDGAHSSVRRSLGLKMVGDSSDAVWGVMDIHPRTDFPDIRRKATIHSSHGALIIIPREGGRLVRFYLQMPPGTDAKTVTLDRLHSKAGQILQDFQFEVAHTVWWSAYTIGQRLASEFSAANDRIFLAGDACHTHSPKAGQGMNVSLQDGYNIGWKLVEVLQGRAPKHVLSTYVSERHKVASDLIDFDRMLTKLYHDMETDSEAAERFKKQFLKSARYMAGLTAAYDNSAFTNVSESDQDIARNIVVGMRFPSAKVVRHCDAKPMELQAALRSDGRWRIVVFSGDLQHPQCVKNLAKASSFLSSDASPVQRYTPQHADRDAHVQLLLVIANNRTSVELEDIPEIFRPVNGQYKTSDLENAYVDDTNYEGHHGQAYQKYGIDPQKGAIVVIRPDQYVSLVTNFENSQVVGRFFDGFASDTVPQQNGSHV
ncbi:phenol 2-monooxygenase [Fusarium albosuccineum]|uniref:Phenol 2-monooxygenase n=1 Tax=Fusarium albosuccineum TaxID=1237068 RepID=A0A8H4NZ94_9HYPO|nr:phenol 2-monooxygenase [Fusarium albosuccineum]